MNSRMTIVFFLVALLLVGVSGCDMIRNLVVEEAKDVLDDRASNNGSPLKEVEEVIDEKLDVSEEDEVEDAADAGVDDAPVDIEEQDFHIFNNVIDLGSKFQEMEITVLGDHSSDEETVNYTFLGEDTIDGISTQQVMVTASDENQESMELWITPENEVIKAVVDDEVMEFPQMYGFAFFNLLLFTVEPDLSWTDWEYSTQSDVTRDLGRGSINATRYEVRYPFAEEFELTYEVAEVAGRNILIRMEVVQGDDVVDYRISRLIPR